MSDEAARHELMKPYNDPVESTAEIADQIERALRGLAGALERISPEGVFVDPINELTNLRTAAALLDLALYRFEQTSWSKNS